ncbi:HpcH/HpaI aldolase family protein [Curtobacterium sp. VKM Ac-1376]|uniref:HpcH/HpaI aldolase family protein n=1 Tax=Curtobacterium sp. VKM Ac-1376 TaxID=123312 RepID=UPI00188ABF56|nr:aldolase/citrate lyase family protein [Curtobacterium sp. VKM Ac-1376]MBF4616376.1 aldolase [Curtobacterium sp. VKM Ac-1376]
MPTNSFAERVRAGERTIGYWVVMDSPVSTERIARSGYDYVAIDAQHGLMDYSGWLRNLTAIDAAGTGAAGMVRVTANEPAAIGQALDAGATGIIVPLIDTAEDAQRLVRAAKYPPVGARSYGPMRSGLRIGPTPAVADAETLVLAMIETAQGLENVDSIAATPGIDGLYVGPSDLAIGLGGSAPGDPAVQDAFDAALAAVLDAARRHDKVAAIHTPGGAVAAERLAQGFTVVTVASDLVHLEQTAKAHLDAARA